MPFGILWSGKHLIGFLHMLPSLALIQTATNQPAAPPSSWWALLAFASAFLTSLVAAPLIARIAIRLGIVDRPDGHRKLHDGPIPLTGGLTILVSLAVGVGVTLWMYPNLLAATQDDTRFLSALFASGFVIVIVGLLDDRFRLRGRQKLAGQILAAMILVMLPRESGIVFDSISLFGHQLSFGDLGPLVTLIFLVGAINALNLIDGVDGLASTTGIVLSFSVAAIAAFFLNRQDGLMISLVLAGALFGFLIYNFPPARMFLGDAGSMLIGLVLGAVALRCSLKGYTTVALVMPTAIWAIPLFDTAMAVVRRKLTGRSIYETDRSHLHHCLQRKGLSGGWLLLVVAILCATTGLGAVAATTMSPHDTDNMSEFGSWVSRNLPAVNSSVGEAMAFIGILTSVLLLVVTRSFGHTEMTLLRNRAQRLIASMLQRNAPQTPQEPEKGFPLQGDHNWTQLWKTLTEFAEEYKMDSVELMVTLPRIGEEYHAEWRRKTDTEAHEEWKSEIPLIVDGMRVGFIRVVGAVGRGSICGWMSELIGGLQTFERELVCLIEDLRRKRFGNDAVAALVESEAGAGNYTQRLLFDPDVVVPPVLSASSAADSSTPDVSSRPEFLPGSATTIVKTPPAEEQNSELEHDAHVSRPARTEAWPELTESDSDGLLSDTRQADNTETLEPMRAAPDNG